MALKGKIASLDEVPESVREFYVQKGDAFVLDVTEHPSQASLKEFRENNVKLLKEKEQLEAALSGVDVEEYRELKSKAQKEREKKLIDAGKVEEMFAERMNPIKAEKDRMEKEFRSEIARRDAKLETLLIDNELRALAAKSGVRATAVEDLLLRGRALFKSDGEKAVAKKGDEIVFGKDGQALSMGEWIGSLAADAPHLFEASQGGGAPKAGSGMPGGLSGGKIGRDDKAAFLANLDDIASGKKQVG